MSQREQFFSYVINKDEQIQKDLKNGEKPSEKASALLDSALDEWAEKNEGKDKEDCSWLKDSREFIAELETLERGEFEDATKKNEKLREVAKNISLAARKELFADIAAGKEAPTESGSGTPAQQDVLSQIRSFFSGLITTFRNIFSGTAISTPTGEKASAKAEKKEAPKEIIDYPELKLKLPSRAVLTSDIQTFRKSTGRPHTGIDIAGMKEGTELLTPGVGKVIDKGYGRMNGNYVAIQYKIGGKKYDFYFLHLQNPSPLEDESIVAADTVLGKVGHTGSIKPGKGGTGDHLHFQVYDSSHKIIDPLPFLPNSIEHQVVAGRDESSTKDAYWSQDHDHDHEESALG